VTLRHKIEHEIHERGPIPFSRYMDLCLYDPQLGYYSRNAEQFGKAGDFYTSSDVHAVFGRLMARQFEEMWRVLGSPERIEVVELGPGRGLFAQDVLDWSEKKFPEFFRALHYLLLESSPALGHRLEANLQRHFATGKVALCPESRLSVGESSAEGVPFRGALSASAAAEGKTGKGTTSVVLNNADFARALAPEVPVIVFSNEFFDALPVEVLSERGKLHISEKERRFVESWSPASPEELEFLDRYSVHPEAGDRVEVPLIAQRWMTQIAATVKSGFIIAIDYGYTRQEQLTGRHRGTIAAYRQHSVNANPYEAPGEQDITAHVNFTALAAAAEEQGMLVQPLLTQSQFLLGIGEPNQFADAFEDCQVPQERAKVALQLKHLVTPAGMGESFRVLVASKGISKKQLSKLSGLSFGKPAAL
jgi:SAM-dependent MidA family methyltransferase